MSRNLEGGHQRLARTRQRKLLKIKLRGFLEVIDRFGDGFALSGGASFGIDGHETAFFGGHEHGCKQHGHTVNAITKRVKQQHGCKAYAQQPPPGTRDVRESLEKLGIGWTIWDSTFGFLSRQDGQTSVDGDIAKALGLKVP